MGRERYNVKMKYKVQDSDEVVDGEILEKLSKDEYKIKIKDNEYVVKILHTDSNVMEFVFLFYLELGLFLIFQSYHISLGNQLIVDRSCILQSLE